MFYILLDFSEIKLAILPNSLHTAIIGIPMVIFIIVIFLNPSKECNGCFEGVIQLILVFSARMCISAYFAVFYLYITELFPLPLRGLGFGISSIFGALGHISSQFILSSITQTDLNPMIIFAVISAAGCGAIKFLPETLNKKLE